MTATNRFYSCFLRTVCVISAVLFIVAICIIPSIPSFADETADVSESNSAISVEITLDKESYAKGEDVVIMLAVTNNTGKKLENVCARYYVPDCFEISEDVVSDLGTLNSRQTVRTQIHATAKTAFGSEIVKDAPDRDGTYVYVILLVACVIVFLTSTSLLVIRERNRKKIAATISFVFAFIFCFSAFSSALLPISADTSDVVLESSVTYEDAKSIINTILPIGSEIEIKNGKITDISEFLI